MSTLNNGVTCPNESNSSAKAAPDMNSHDQKNRRAAAAIAEGLCSAAQIGGYEVGVGDRVTDSIIHTSGEFLDIAIETQHEHKEKDIVGATKNHLRHGLNVVWVAAEDSSEHTRIQKELGAHMSNTPSVTVIKEQTVELGDILNLRNFDYRVESLDEIGIRPALYRLNESVFSASRTAEKLRLRSIDGLVPVWSAVELQRAVNRGALKRLSPNGSLNKI